MGRERGTPDLMREVLYEERVSGLRDSYIREGEFNGKFCERNGMERTG